MMILFPDNTVLVNVAHVGELALLEGLLNGQGAWTGTIAAECERSSRFPDLEQLAGVGTFLGQPLMPTLAERQDMLVIQNHLAQPGDPPLKSLGEAETIAVIVRRHLVATFITDDGGARRYVEQNEAHIRVLRTTDLLALAVRVQRLGLETARGHVATLIAKERRGISRERFEAAIVGT